MSVAPTPDDNETGKDVLVIDFAGDLSGRAHSKLHGGS